MDRRVFQTCALCASISLHLPCNVGSALHNFVLWLVEQRGIGIIAGSGEFIQSVVTSEAVFTSLCHHTFTPNTFFQVKFWIFLSDGQSKSKLALLCSHS